jgi:GxxExxY protein
MVILRYHESRVTQKRKRSKDAKMDKEELNKLSNEIIGIAIEIHKELGPGLVEKVYQRILYLELKRYGYSIAREKKVSIIWKKNLVGYQIVDFLINKELILEIKAKESISPIDGAQLLSYLKIAKKRLGLVLNFGPPKLEINRIVNKL